MVDPWQAPGLEDTALEDTCSGAGLGHSRTTGTSTVPKSLPPRGEQQKFPR